MENQPNLQGDSILTDNDAIAKHHLSTAFLSLPVSALNKCRFTRKIHYDEDQKTCICRFDDVYNRDASDA